MKRILYLGNNKYVTVDTYHASPESLRSKLLQAFFITIIAAITGSAMVGVDILQLPQEQSNVRSTGY